MTIYELCAALRNAETAGLGAAELASAGAMSLPESYVLLRESLGRVQAARRAFEASQGMGWSEERRARLRAEEAAVLDEPPLTPRAVA